MAKSLYTLPMLFFNLGGEMLYVLDQRLKAQNILEDKANKGKLILKQTLLAFLTPHSSMQDYL